MSDNIDFIPVRRRRLSEELADRIMGSIAAGRLRPGDQLPPITGMARSFRVAPATVREALAHLEAKRIVEIRQGAGVFIAASAA
ncbi:MAG TPA: winged helix-turn-helix domain-containing protein [Gemmatimonadaceae bacterium]|jgi:DNA-binding FadR family transcriptional regulator|nr:winged helix-turn-helix domain-containing protein [Gemmatimonadaceae bacterium]